MSTESQTTLDSVIVAVNDRTDQASSTACNEMFKLDIRTMNEDSGRDVEVQESYKLAELWLAQNLP